MTTEVTNKMRVREHRESLADSVATTAEIDPTFHALAEFFSARHNKKYKAEDFKVLPSGFDARIAWNSHIVLLNGDAIGTLLVKPTNQYLPTKKDWWMYELRSLATGTGVTTGDQRRAVMIALHVLEGKTWNEETGEWEK